MKYLLDTNTCIQYINGRSKSIAQRLSSLAEGEAVVCSVVKAELFFGALRSQNVSKTLEGQQQFLALFESLPFDDSATMHYARIRANLTAKGTSIGANDYIIAAIALAHDVTLVTHNTREFGRIEGLKLQDWETDGV
jgi:tRNA(fMet)-specific endonuclease VapC